MTSLTYSITLLLLAVAAVAILLFRLGLASPRARAQEPPANDNFAGAIAIPEPLPYTNSQDTILATTELDEPAPSCTFSEVASTVWYRFTPTEAAILIADTAGSDFDAFLAVWTEDTFGLAEVACSSFDSSRLAIQAIGEQTYYFQVGRSFPDPLLLASQSSRVGGRWPDSTYRPADSQPVATGITPGPANLVFNLDTFTIPPCPASQFSFADPTGDTFGFETPQIDITSVSGGSDADTFCLTVEFDGPIDPPDAGTDRAVVGFVDFDTDGNLETGLASAPDFFCPDPAGLGVESEIDLFGASGLLIPISGPSDGSFAIPLFDQSSFTLVIPLAALGGDDSFNFAMVLGTLSEPTDCAPNGGTVGCAGGACTLVPPPPPPPNDDFANSAMVPNLPFTDSESTRFASVEPGEPAPCAGISQTVWYSFTPNTDVFLTADTFGSDFDTALAVYTGDSLETLMNIDCNDDTASLQAEIQFSASAGTTYHFQVGGFIGDAGSLAFNLVTIKNPDADTDGDGIPNSTDLDDDADGCTDVAELQTAAGSETSGGRRDPHNFWDFFDPTRDGSVGFGDCLLLVQHFGRNDNNGEASINRNSDPLTTPDPGPGSYHPLVDRGAVVGPNPWNAGPPDGAIGFGDFLALVSQFGHSCA